MEPKLILGTALVWAVIFIVPIVIYGVLSAVTGLQPPGGSPVQFLLGTAVSKLGTAIAFAGIFYLARDVLGGQWLLYAGLWWLMAGAISETIYFPLSGLIVHWLVR